MMIGFSEKDMLTILEYNYFIIFLRPVQPMLARREPKRFRRRFRKRMGSFGAEPDQVQYGSGKGSRIFQEASV